MREFIRKHTLLCLMLLAGIWALSFQGSRGLMEPDEGRYTNVALQILQHDDWVSLYRNQDSLHFTKPPLTYWMVAASVSLFGHNEWAVRLPMALALLLLVYLGYRLGRIFVPSRPWLPALFIPASPLLLLAASWVNTDTVLAAMTTLAMTCYAQYRFGNGNRRWLDAMWCAFALAFMTKGPPGLLPLLVVVVFALWHRDGRALLRPLGLLGFAVIGLTWYAVVIQRHPGLLDYFLGHEVVARIATDTHNRNSEWYGPFTQFLPTLLLGTLPALIALAVFRKQAPAPAMPNEQTRFLWLWLALPLVVFSLAQSRLPLYVLGLTIPALLLLSRRLEYTPFGRGAAIAMALWLAAVLAIKGLLPVALDDHDKDSRAFAEEIRPMLPGKPEQIIFVEDMSRNGLNLYFDADIKKVSFTPRPKPISDSSYDASLAEELAQAPDRRLFIMKREIETRFVDETAKAGITPIKLGEWIEDKKPGARDRMLYVLPGEFTLPE
ncbi:MAG: ArnT family glycosyltransferase [Arenimonas sp.]